MYHFSPRGNSITFLEKLPWKNRNWVIDECLEREKRREALVAPTHSYKGICQFSSKMEFYFYYHPPLRNISCRFSCALHTYTHTQYTRLLKNITQKEGIIFLIWLKWIKLKKILSYSLFVQLARISGLKKSGTQFLITRDLDGADNGIQVKLGNRNWV